MAAVKTFRAKNEVHITETPGKPGDKAKGIAPTPPKVKIIPAKGKFSIDPDSEVCKDLLRMGAIEPADDEKAEVTEKVVTKKAPAKKAPAKKPAAKKPAAKPADDGNGEGGDGDDLV